RYESRGDVLLRAAGHPVLAVKPYGRGRVVALAYVGEGFVPDPVDSVETRTYWDYREYQYSLLARSILWASGRPEAVHIQSLRASGTGPLEIDLASGAARTVDVEVHARSEFGADLGTQR